MGGSSGSPSTQTSTTTTELPEWLQPHAERFLGRANALSKQPFDPYQGQRVAGLTPDHYGAIGMGREAMTGALPGALNTLGTAASGGFMGANPYLESQFNRAADSVQARTNNATAMQGLTNAGVRQQETRDLNDLATGIYGGAYNQDMSNMLGAAQGLPGFASSSAQFGLGLGDVSRDYQQSLLNEAIRAFTEQKTYPYTQLDVLGNALGMSMGGGGTTVSTQPGYYQPNSTAGMLGAGALGLGAAQMFMDQG